MPTTDRAPWQAVEDASDSDLPGRAGSTAAQAGDPTVPDHASKARERKSTKTHERRRHRDEVDRSGDYQAFPLPSLSRQPPRDDHGGPSSDALNNAGPRIPGQRHRREQATLNRLQKQSDYDVGFTDIHGMRRPQLSYAGKPADAAFAEGPPRPTGETVRYRQPFNPVNQFERIDEEGEFSGPYFGGAPYYGRQSYPTQRFNTSQPSFSQQYQPVNYGNQSYNLRPNDPPTARWQSDQRADPQADRRAAPAAPEAPEAPEAPVRVEAQWGNKGPDSEWLKVMKELEDNRNELAQKDDIIKKYRVRELEKDMLHDATEKQEQANKLKEQAKLELETVNQKRIEEQKEEMARLEYKNKVLQAAQEAREHMEQKLRDEERLRKAEEQKVLSLEIDMRRRIETEIAEEAERRKREVEKRMYLEREIRAQLMAERREDEERTLREELRKQHIEKRLEYEFEMKRRRADELQQYKEGIEAKVRMEANQIIGSEQRKLDMEKMRLEIQQGTERVIRDTLQGDDAVSLHSDSIHVDDYLDPDQSIVDFNLQNTYPHSRMDSRHVYETNRQGISHPFPNLDPRRPPEPVAPPMGPVEPRFAWNGPNANLGYQRLGWGAPAPAQTTSGRPASVGNHLNNYSGNPFGQHYFSHLGSQQQLHMPNPTYRANPSNLMHNMAPEPSLSGFSSDLNLRRHPPPIPQATVLIRNQGREPAAGSAIHNRQQFPTLCQNRVGL
ncbi:hypothetical protein PG997_011558 [Apiospora hydei]|uniref:Uncharacterized protein n=1 Tax=Apiospora hydei TaxID=1337664 RepID=A0ABR1VJG3_9PEZI